MRYVQENLQYWSYALDYFIVVVCIAAFSALDLAEPHHQQFSLTDVRIQQPYAVHERVPAAQAAIIAILAPFVLIVLWNIVFEGRILVKRRLKLRDRLWETNMGILGLLLAVGLALVTTNIFKNTVGRPRPDFLDRCQAGTTVLTTAYQYVLSNSSICTQTDHAILKDGFRSFPSGHSSTSFSGLGYLAIWLSGKLRLWNGSGQVWKVVLVMTPLLAASLVAISRIMDERHHPFDVLFGSALGCLAAWISYRQYFPAVRTSGISYSPRRYKDTQGAILSTRNGRAQELRDEADSQQHLGKSSDLA